MTTLTPQYIAEAKRQGALDATKVRFWGYKGGDDANHRLRQRWLVTHAPGVLKFVARPKFNADRQRRR